MLEQFNPVTAFLVVGFLDAVVLSVGFRVIFLNVSHRQSTGTNQQNSTNVEGPANRRRNDTLRSRVLQTKPSQQEWEDGCQNGTNVVQQTLNTISITLLIIVDHVTNHHLEWLHGDVRRQVQEGNGNCTEHQCRK